MTTFTINIRALKATAIAAGKEEVRYYLMGVNIEHDATGVLFVATDNHRLIASRHDWIGEVPTSFAPIIVPLTLIKKIKLNKYQQEATITIDTKTDGAAVLSVAYDGSTYSVNAIARTFPAWRHIIPHSADGVAAQYDPEYLAEFKEAGRILEGNTNSPSVAVSYNGGKPALVRFWHDDNQVQSFGVIMPMRPEVAPALSAPPSWARAATNKPETVATASRDDVEAAALKAVKDALTA
jgi:DNA polymerase-3 subunit beta